MSYACKESYEENGDKINEWINAMTKIQKFM